MKAFRNFSFHSYLEYFVFSLENISKNREKIFILNFIQSVTMSMDDGFDCSRVGLWTVCWSLHNSYHAKPFVCFYQIFALVWFPAHWRVTMIILCMASKNNSVDFNLSKNKWCKTGVDHILWQKLHNKYGEELLLTWIVRFFTIMLWVIVWYMRGYYSL